MVDFYEITPAQAFCAVAQDLLYAETARPRGMLTREMLDVNIYIEDPMSIPFDVDGRDLNFTIAALEILQLLAQTPADGLVRRKARAVAAYQDDGISYGNYGARLRGQMTNVVQTLINDPHSRRAVVTIYDGPRDLLQDTSDIPCTLTAQFFIRDGALRTRVSMRSNDAWLGLPYDLTQFCALHCTMAQIMNVAPGRYTHTVGSMHLYEPHWSKVEKLGDAISNPQTSLFALNGEDPSARLEQVVERCQDFLDDAGQAPLTRFEAWLLAATHDEEWDD